MSRVLRVTCLNGLLGAQVNSDGNDRQDADVSKTGQTVIKRILQNLIGSSMHNWANTKCSCLSHHHV